MAIFKYSGKALTKKQTKAFLERIRMKPKATYDYDARKKKFVKR